jgi:hypothetical protein
MFLQLDNSIKDEIIANQRMVPPGKSLMALNGALINIEDLDLYLYVLTFFLDSVVSDYFTLFFTLLCYKHLSYLLPAVACQNILQSVYP